MINAIHRETVVELCDKLGPTLVAIVAGSRDSKVTEKWLSGIEEPSDEEIKRLVFTSECLAKVFDAEKNADTGLAWLVGQSIGKDSCPAFAIGKDDFDAVIVSLNNLIEDNWT